MVKSYDNFKMAQEHVQGVINNMQQTGELPDYNFSFNVNQNKNKAQELQSARERQLEQDEYNAQSEKDKLKYQLDNLNQREKQLNTEIQAERDRINSEYRRLAELQNSINFLEKNVQDDLEKDKRQFDQTKAGLIKEHEQRKQEQSEKHQAISLKISELENQNKQYFELYEQKEAQLKEVLRKKEEQQESQLREKNILGKQLKELENKIQEQNKLEDEFHYRIKELDREEDEFEQYSKLLQQMLQEASKQTNEIENFQQYFVKTQNELAKKQEELTYLQHSVQNKKKDIELQKANQEIKQKSLDEMRNMVVNTINKNPQALNYTQALPIQTFTKPPQPERTFTKSNQSTQPQLQQTMRSTTGYKKFNLNNYEAELQKIDGQIAQQKAFISTEKQNVWKDKLKAGDHFFMKTVPSNFSLDNSETISKEDYV